MRGVLRRCDDYLDAVAALGADAVDVGPLRAFVSRAPWPYYVRPRPGTDLTGATSITASDVSASADVLRAAGQPISFEWVEQLAPSLAGLLGELGYAVHSHPLLARELAPGSGPPSAGVSGSLAARRLEADSAELAAALAVQQIGFDSPGTALGAAGATHRDAQPIEDSLVAHVRERIRDGLSVVVVVESPVDGIVACGWHQPVGDVTEIVGVATLPSHRRRGAAAVILDLLVTDAVDRGVTLAMLSADDDDVARIYEGAGFSRVGTVGAAEPPQ